MEPFRRYSLIEGLGNAQKSDAGAYGTSSGPRRVTMRGVDGAQVTSAQNCQEPGCTRPPAFKTLTRPTWCDEHITAILVASGIEPLEPFVKPKKQRFTRCLRCGCEAHYSLDYTLRKREESAGTEATCRACFWREWAQRSHRSSTPTTNTEARQCANENGFDYLERSRARRWRTIHIEFSAGAVSESLQSG